ncbi:hypothetical protein [Burkholderia sp. S171]|uniref:hypothetical protein n=1 Tax=Burkholderia sp. S171 TaxID=1641860 RepID=UPI00131A63CC|nr:hypothetical protein [Burkholderia sp. S171]
MTKNDAWLFQVRITVSPETAAILRRDPEGASPALRDLLRRHNASLTCQFDAFSDYVNEAERLGPEKYPLYQWTRETIENPEKKAKYLKSFTVYVDSEELYPGETADLLRAELSALAGIAGIERVVKIDSNPANNPQPPKRVQ